MKLFLDDIRCAPDTWTVARSYNDCIRMLKENDVDEISLDHDLGELKNGYHVCLWIVEHEYFSIKKVYIHSANPVGVKNMAELLNRYMPEDTKIYCIGPNKEYIEYYR